MKETKGGKKVAKSRKKIARNLERREIILRSNDFSKDTKKVAREILLKQWAIIAQRYERR